MVKMAIATVMTCGKLFQLKRNCQFVRVNFFGLKLKKTFFSWKKYLQLFLLLSIMFYN